MVLLINKMFKFILGLVIDEKYVQDKLLPEKQNEPLNK